MKVDTFHFGEIEVLQEEIVTFSGGIPGFEQLTSFAILRFEEHAPFYYLQSLQETMISFVITNPFGVYPDYEFHLPISEQEELEISEEAQLAVWSIVTIRDSAETATMNLLAPIVVNVERRLGKQIVLHNSHYKTKHPIFRENFEMPSGPSEALKGVE
ncbi:flagellar assembly protein FliW [Paenibacillus hexagrammi]|uniref:Flagellar assembly factor FliW n=1 Tax=Paenibacillus hexagrammi TaxID=2908839 RepID=A0ABY3SJB7_9BACL|nr:flagellar assembly protein FliW [Paenibacillus sp. YPD9-1]UJF33226.1 flagellar assembly protein FliW [Paenibacillus sp. YPD9-1]